MNSLVINAAGEGNSASFDLIQNRIESLSSKMDKLIHIQEKVLNRLDGMSQDIDVIEQDMENLKVDKEEIHLPPKVMNQTQVMGREVREICQEMSTIMSVVNQRSEQQALKLEGMEKLVLSMQQVISFVGDMVKSSKVMEMMFKGPAARKSSKHKDSKGKKAIKRKSSADALIKKLDKLKEKDGTDKASLSQRSLKAQKKMKPPDAADISLKKQALLLEEVQKLNKENTEKLGHQLIPLDLEAGVSPKDQQPDSPACNLVDYLREDTQVAVAEKHKGEDSDSEHKVVDEEPEDKTTVPEKETKPDVEELKQQKEEEKLKVPEETQEESVSAAEVSEAPLSLEDENEGISPSDIHKDSTPEIELDQINVSQGDLVVEENTKGLVVENEEEKNDDDKEDEENLDSEGWAVFKADGVEFQLDLKYRVERERKENNVENDTEETNDDDDVERFYIDTTPPPIAPFNHRIVSAKPNQIRNFYTINWQEVLGGGRFGQVHKCVENSSGLTLAAKVIKARSQKEKEVVKNEIQVMNNLDHASLIQLYAAYESRNDIILVLEYVGGGELFDRIIDENYTLMELDAVVFIRQICEGLQHMHKMSILHLDLKPENILCVNRVTNKIKIIDFGLARVYKPREKLRVNFGTPEFLAPEVINYDFVSFNTDMWSLGVITYMLLSGLCPFLGDDDNQTLNNILACQWNFDEPEFVDTSEEAKDFIRRLLILNKSWRMGASESLRHPWLADPVLHHRLYTKKTMCRSRRSSCVPPTDG
ncbi:myosin light chain kinase 2, skeletal/cardiac muscle [Melanotaenia boesemani]|uniref:myosin light chain kinase 2, skeletal/cardiac muscle n=1 Tax=Melanotaenia boesemani TaxID=1250792 RepID=UPI001C058D19|nr:myosin light chain kinase 2, skeletal/cardiac muscle [Melanotaenia boesemani]